ncbi:hypothetical protein ADL26_05140, partial [Thermoactinomyces vulgaris]
HSGCHIGPVGDGGELDHPDVLGRIASGGDPGRGLDDETGLARAARPGDGDESGGRGRRGEGVKVGFAADETGELRFQVGALLGARGRGAALAEDVQVELGEFGGGVDPEFVGEALAGALERVEGFGGAAGRVQGAHEEGLPALVEREGGGEGLEFGEDVGAGGDLQGEAFAGGLAAQALQA